MCGISCYWLESSLMAKQFFLTHDFQHALMVNSMTSIPEFCSDPPVSVKSELGSDLLNQAFAIIWGDLFKRLWLFIIAAATYLEGLDRDIGRRRSFE